MADAAAAVDFAMYGARAAIAGGMLHIEEQTRAIERAVVENPGLAFDLAKTLVESACRTILTERSVVFELDDDLPRLFKIVTTSLPLLPSSASAETEARKSLLQTLNGLHTALQGVCELRNAYGFASHGAAGPRPRMETVQAQLAAQAGDAIVGFLYRLHRAERAPERSRPGRSLTVDKVIDLTYDPVVIAGQPYAVSEALYGTDQQAYLALAAGVQESRDVLPALARRYPTCLRADLVTVVFVHHEESVFLKVVGKGGEVALENTEFISDGGEGEFFSSSRSPDQNAELLVTSFGPFSIVNCFELFTEEAARKVFEANQAGTLDALFPPISAGIEPAK